MRSKWLNKWEHTIVKAIVAGVFTGFSSPSSIPIKVLLLVSIDEVRFSTSFPWLFAVGALDMRWKFSESFFAILSKFSDGVCWRSSRPICCVTVAAGVGGGEKGILRIFLCTDQIYTWIYGLISFCNFMSIVFVRFNVEYGFWKELSLIKRIKFKLTVNQTESMLQFFFNVKLNTVL